MKKSKFKKVAKTLALMGLLAFVATFCVFAFYYIKISIEYGDVKFDKEKLVLATSYAQVVDIDNQDIGKTTVDGRSAVLLDTLPTHVKNAFIAIEDQQFYKHNGLNYKRIVKSVLTNIRYGYAKEGASTISQQLIKNTHLSNDKTIERKLKEVFLTKKLEKTFSKDEILEIYLNIIYFGNGCFGIEDASQFYFNKSASDLSIAESATLAGIIKSPKLYNPLTHYENCLQRRNLVIRQMENCGYISENDAHNSTSEELAISKSRKQECIKKAVLDEACTILKMPEKELINSRLKINTFIDAKLQTIVDNIDLSLLETNDGMPNYAIIIENNKDASIQAIRYSNVDILTMKRQPASCLKPFLVYAPNLESGNINLQTKIDDSPINFGGFSPTNADKKFQGYISTKEALSTSSNVCATKLLSYYGIENAKKCATKFGFTFNNKDNHLALALGSMYYGCDLFTLTNSYATLARNGVYMQPKLISGIYSNQMPLYLNKSATTQAISPETAYQLTLALQDCSANGTGKKLSKFSKYVACKTGTNGAPNSSKNTDAYNLSYSTDYTVCVWIGANGQNLLPSTMNGGNHASIIAKSIWEQLNPTTTFTAPQNIVEKAIDKITYEDSGQIKLADKNAPQRYVCNMVFNKKYMPQETSTLFSAPKPVKLTATHTQGQVTLIFSCNKYYTYTIYKCVDDNTHILQTIKNKDGELNYCDKDLPEKGALTYYVTTNAPNSSKTSSSDKIKIIL